MGKSYSAVVVAVVALALIVSAASSTAAVIRANTVDAKLVGKWTRKVTSADVKRTGGSGGPCRNRLHAHRQEERGRQPELHEDRRV